MTTRIGALSQVEKAAGVTSITLTLPGLAASGDVVVAGGGCNSATLVGNQSGWTTILNKASVNDTLSPTAWMGYKTLTGTDITNGFVTLGTVPSAVGNFGGVVLRNVSTTQDFTAVYLDKTGTADGNFTFPTQTATQTGVTLIYVVSQATVATASMTPPSSPAAFTEDADRVSGRNMSMGDLIWTGSGATGSITVVSGASTKGVGLLAALRSAASAFTGTATLSGSGTLATTQAPGPTQAAAFSGGGTLSATGLPSVGAIPTDFTNADWVKSGTASATASRLTIPGTTGVAATATAYTLDEARVFWKVAQQAGSALLCGFYVDSNNYLAFNIGSGTTASIQKIVGGAPTLNTSFTYDAAKPFLSMRESGGTVTFERSATGQPGTWESLGTTAAPAYAISGNPFSFRVLGSGTAWIESLNQSAAAYPPYTFEDGTTQGWYDSVLGNQTVTLSNSSTQAHGGTKSLRVAWPTDDGTHSASAVQAFTTTPGLTYLTSLWVYVPSGSPDVYAYAWGKYASPLITTKDAWVQVPVIFVADQSFQFIGIYTTTPSAGTFAYIDDVPDVTVVFTATGTATLSGSGTLATTQTPGPTQTAALSGSGTLATVQVPRPTQVAALSGSGALTTVQVPRPTQTAALSGAGTLATTAVLTAAGAAALSGSGTLTTAQVPRPAATVALSGSGSLTTVQVPALPVAVALSGSGTLSVVGVPGYRGTATLSGDGSLTTAQVPRPTQAVTLSGSGTLTTTQALTAAGTATLSGSGTLTTTGLPRVTGAVAALSGSGTLVTTAVLTAAGAAALSGSGTLAATGTAAAGAAGVATLSGSGTLTTTQQVPSVTQTVPLSGAGTLSTTGVPRITQTATLAGSGTLSATGTAAAGASGVATLSGSGTLSTTQVPRPTGLAALSGSGTLSTTALPRVSGTATLSGAGFLSVGAAVFGTAAFSGAGTLTTTQVPVVSGVVTLSGAGTLATTQKPVATGTADLTGDGKLRPLPTPPLPALVVSVAFTGSGTLTAVGPPSVGTATLSGSGTLTLTAFAFIGVLVTPDERRFVVSYEVRLSVVDRETRVVRVPPDQNRLTMERETRRIRPVRDQGVTV